jgi:hypothetical protein
MSKTQYNNFLNECIASYNDAIHPLMDEISLASSEQRVTLEKKIQDLLISRYSAQIAQCILTKMNLEAQTTDFAVTHTEIAQINQKLKSLFKEARLFQASSCDKVLDMFILFQKAQEHFTSAQSHLLTTLIRDTKLKFKEFRDFCVKYEKDIDDLGFDLRVKKLDIFTLDSQLQIINHTIAQFNSISDEEVAELKKDPTFDEIGSNTSPRHLSVIFQRMLQESANLTAAQKSDKINRHHRIVMLCNTLNTMNERNKLINEISALSKLIDQQIEEVQKLEHSVYTLRMQTDAIRLSLNNYSHSLHSDNAEASIFTNKLLEETASFLTNEQQLSLKKLLSKPQNQLAAPRKMVSFHPEIQEPGTNKGEQVTPMPEPARLYLLLNQFRNEIKYPEPPLEEKIFLEKVDELMELVEYYNISISRDALRERVRRIIADDQRERTLLGLPTQPQEHSQTENANKTNLRIRNTITQFRSSQSNQNDSEENSSSPRQYHHS